MSKMPMWMAAAALAVLSSLPARAAEPTETLRYDWRLRGALSWVAGLKFPTSGSGTLQTSLSASQLRIDGGSSFIEYSSRMDSSRRTLASMNGYAFGSKSERKETVYDYASNVARLQANENGRVENKTRPLPVDNARDVLTTITYLREHATTINAPLTTEVYADGKPYRVQIIPDGRETVSWQGRNVTTRRFKVVAAPNATKKFPGLKVWISEDDRRLPLRIMLDQQYASLDLRLKA